MAVTAEKAGDMVVPVFKITLGAVSIYALYKVGQKVGIFQTAEGKEVEEATEGASQSSADVREKNAYVAFAPRYATSLIVAWNKKFSPKKWDAKKQLGFLTAKKTDEFVKRMYNSKGLFKDNPNAVYSVFREIQTQYQLSVISYFFTSVYKIDLFEYLKSFLDENEMDKIINIVKNYPQYYK